MLVDQFDNEFGHTIKAFEGDEQQHHNSVNRQDNGASSTIRSTEMK